MGSFGHFLDHSNDWIYSMVAFLKNVMKVDFVKDSDGDYS